MRYETKLTAGCGMAELGLSWLRHACDPDPVYPAARVFSVYYDTPRLTSYDEKANGDYLKTKVRLRWYEPAQKDDAGRIPAFLEIKERFGRSGEKFRKKLYIANDFLYGRSLEDEAWLELLNENGHDLGPLLRSALFPMLLVVYDRERFICPFTGARVCLDQCIHAERPNRGFLLGADRVELQTVVLEVKSSRLSEIPWLKDLYFGGFRVRSFSKYAVCLSQMIHGVGAS